NIEFITSCRTFGCSGATSPGVNGNRSHRIWPGEITGRFRRHGLAHELLPDRGGNSASGKSLAARPRFVVSRPDAGYQLRRITYKPGIPIIIGRAGFPGGVV